MMLLKYRSLILPAVFLFCLSSCRPEDLKLDDMGSKPKADFVILPGSDANTVLLVNKTSTPVIAHWFQNSTGIRVDNKDSARMNFTFMGTYPVTLIVTGKGGIDSITKQVVIAQNDPNACNGTAIGFITGCGTKVWKLDPAARAYQVGPSPDDGSWWASGVGDITGRSCEFNDTYTFTFNAAGTFAYDNKGDYYPDGYLGSGGYSCEPNSMLTAVQQPWATNLNHKFSVIKTGGVAGLGQLKVTGLGAHIGLQKVNNGGEITSAPVSAITYDILAMTHDNTGNYDLLTLGIKMPGNYWWTFRLRSF